MPFGNSRMEVQIADVGERDGRVSVVFTCEFGAGEAYWVGPAPIGGEKRFVELELRRALSTDEDLLETEQPTGIYVKDGTTFVVGEIESVETTGLVSLSLGSHRLSVEVSGQPPEIGRRYRIAASDLEAFDCQL